MSWIIVSQVHRMRMLRIVCDIVIAKVDVRLPEGCMSIFVKKVHKTAHLMRLNNTGEYAPSSFTILFNHYD